MNAMLEFIDSLKKGFEVWNKAWLTQIFALLILSFVAMLVIAPLAFMIAIYSAGGTTIITNPSTFLTESLIQAMAANPGFWLALILTILVGAIFLTIIFGAIQKIAHDYITGAKVSFEKTIKELIPLIPALIVVCLASLVILLIPALIVAEIANIYRDVYPPIMSFILFQGTVSITIVDVALAGVTVLIFILLGGPYFLSVSAVVIDGAGFYGIRDGWKLYLRKFLSVATAMVILFIILIPIGLTFFLPINGIVLAGSSLELILLNVFILMLLGVVLGFFASNWIDTSLYVFYTDIRGKKSN